MFIDLQHSGQKPNLSPAKKALLEKRLQGRNSENLDLTIQKRTSDFSPLSPPQLRLWYLYQMDPEDPGYNYSTAIRLIGNLDIPVLQKCINEIVRRHESFRTTFLERNGQPAQIITAVLNVSLETHDLSYLTKPLREAECIRLAKMNGKKPFDLSNGPLLRVTLIHAGDNEFVLLFTVHHIAFDGWSAGVLLKEFATLYRAFAKGDRSPLPELPIQYADFACWQYNKGLQCQQFERQLAYWKQQLKGIPELLSLPSDRPRPPVMSYKGAIYSFSLSSALTEQLHKIGRSLDCTLFTLLLSAFTMLLHRYSGANDICIGIPVAGRTKVELESLIGFFVNTLVIRTQIDSNATCAGIIKKTQERVLDAQSNQDVPFDKLVEELRPQRHAGYNPIFQVMFVLHDVPSQALDLPELSLEKLELDYEISKFDLILHATETNGLELAFEYSTELFDPERIERLANYLKLIVQLFVNNLNAHIGSFALLSEQERNEIATWNATQRLFPRRQFLHTGFENQAQARPQSVAVSCGQQMLSYYQLDRRANQLAHWLRLKNVGVDVRVGICLERSVEMIVGVLAILKAGGVYVPINPAYPKERIADILQSCGASILLTQDRLSSDLPCTGLSVFCMDSAWQTISSLPDDHLALAYQNSAAYVIYTSGSTGKPKGVIVTHENAVASTLARFDYYSEPLEGFLLMSPLAFDSSVAGIFWTLSQGGRLCIPTEAETHDIEALIDKIEQHQLSHLLCLPSLYSIIVENISPQRAEALRTVIVAGEACPPDLVAKHYARLPTVQLYNEYGPTEGTVWSSVYAAHNADSVSGTSLSIGKPIANSQLYLLDRYLNPVSVGVPGELYVGGLGVTRGYLGIADLTAERYLPDPFGPASGGRLYKTGDLACYRPDGKIDFLGRIDHQVKIRGFRIELGEIETKLRQYPEIQDAVVTAHEDATGNKRLVAYWVNDPNCFSETEELRAFLKAALPDYMIPVAFVRLDKLPLTPNGKLDRKALPDPDFNGQSGQPYAASRNMVEQQLTTIWRQALGLERIGVHDNFFALGGDSIIAIQMAGKARQFGLVVAPQQLFQHQTIAELALVVGGLANSQNAEQGLVSGSVPLTPIQCWFFEQNLPDPGHWNQAVLLEITGAVDAWVFEQALAHLLAHHDALRSRFSLDNGRWSQTILEQEFNVLFHRIDLSELRQIDHADLIEAECSRWQARLNLAEGPLLRMVWFDLGITGKPRLLIVIHHLVVDGVSWRILLEDLQTICLQLMQSETVMLPFKTTAFKHWLERLQQWAQREDLQKQMAYWQSVSEAGMAPLPVDWPDGSAKNGHAATVMTALSKTETQALVHEVGAAYRTEINDLLLSALAQTVAAWAHGADILIDMEGHGREGLFDEVDLSRTLGWFTSLYPLRLTLPGDNNPGAVIKTIKETIRRIPDKGIGYQVLRYLQADGSAGSLRAHSGAPILFNYLGRFDRVLAEDALFILAQESAGQALDAEGLRCYELEVNAHIANEQLHVLWTYSSERYRRDTIEGLAASYMQALTRLIEHCLQPKAGGFTPYDFPLANIGQAKLDSLLSRLAKK